MSSSGAVAQAIYHCSCCVESESTIAGLEAKLRRQRSISGNYKRQFEDSKTREEKLKAQLSEIRNESAVADKLRLLGKIRRLENLLDAAGLPGIHNPLRRLGEENKRLKEGLRHFREENRELKKRVKVLEEENGRLGAINKRLNHCLYGSKSESRAKSRKASRSQGVGTGRKRGHQPGSDTHGRTDRSNLGVVEQYRELDEERRRCTECGKAYASNGWESSQTVEIKVKAHIRRVHRRRYRSACGCKGKREVVVGAENRLFARSGYGISF